MKICRASGAEQAVPLRMKNNRQYPKAAAVIDIASSDLSLSIAQWKKGEVSSLDRLIYPLSLGHEVFTGKKISFECFREMSRALSGFTALMKEYGVTQYRAVATTALREAENRAFVLDQLKVQNNLKVEVLEADQEKTLIYFDILSTFRDTGALQPGNSLFAFIGSGSIGTAVYDGSVMVYSQNIPIGALKLHDMLSTIQEQTDDFGTVAEEYLASSLGFQGISRFPISNVVLTGNDMKLIAQLCGVQQEGGLFRIPSEKLAGLYRRIRSLRPDKVAERYNISESAAETLYSALAIYMQLIGKTQAKVVLAPQVNLWDAVMRLILVPRRSREYDEYIRKNAVSCANRIADNYGCDRTHIETVRKISCTIFDRLKPLYGMNSAQRLVLELAAVLHESGHFVSENDHLPASFDIIRHTDIYGVTNRDILLAAYVARYNEDAVPDFRGLEYVSMTEAERTVIAKLVAVFRLANALDKSRRQKIRSVKVQLLGDQMFVAAQSDANLFLEKWAFEQCSAYFKEVFGLYPVLKIRQDLI